MAAARFDSTVEQGVDWMRSFQIVDKETRVPRDISGWTPLWAVQGNIEFAATVDGPNGIVHVHADHDLTASLARGRLSYTLTLTQPDDTITRFLQGVLNVVA
jgi:hypothetical protein